MEGVHTAGNGTGARLLSLTITEVIGSGGFPEAPRIPQSLGIDVVDAAEERKRGRHIGP